MMPSDLHHNIFVITGPVHSGKTTFLLRVTELLRDKMVSMSGFLCEGTFSNDKRSSFTLVNLENFNRFPLATTEKRAGWDTIGPFYFNPAAMAEGEKAISSGLENGSGLLVVDEVGPLELRGGGWSELLDSLMSEYMVSQIWVVRDQILDEVLSRWKIAPECVFHVNTGEEFRIVNTILDHVRHNENSKGL
jgi:nucleoside-triphosphatase THEP1